MAGVDDLLDLALAQQGIGEPNKFQAWYNKSVDNLGNSNWAWCAAFVSWVFAHSGNGKLIKYRAYTVYMANDFNAAHRWYVGTDANVRKAQPGDVVLFDWGGSNSRGAVDHVGIVVKNLGGGRLQTIEGNTSNKVRLRTRDASVIAGYGRPDWSKVGGGQPAKKKPVAPSGSPLLLRGSKGSRVADLQRALVYLKVASLVVDGIFGPKTEAALIKFQTAHKLVPDGEYGYKSAAVLKAALK